MSELHRRAFLSGASSGTAFLTTGMSVGALAADDAAVPRTVPVAAKALALAPPTVTGISRDAANMDVPSAMSPLQMTKGTVFYIYGTGFADLEDPEMKVILCGTSFDSNGQLHHKTIHVRYTRQSDTLIKVKVIRLFDIPTGNIYTSANGGAFHSGGDSILTLTVVNPDFTPGSTTTPVPAIYI